jgi:hypothetical protein
MTSQNLDGQYRLVGIHDMAAEFLFTPDGRFEFYYAYGASDRNATGTYSIQGDTIKLASDKKPGHDFSIDKQTKKGKGFTIQATAPNPYLLQHIICFYFIGEQQEYAESNADGIIHLDIPSCDKIYLKHELFPDIPTLIKEIDNTNNHFEVSLLPSLGQVSFFNIDLFQDGETLTCLQKYFMPFSNIRFEKE